MKNKTGQNNKQYPGSFIKCNNDFSSLHESKYKNTVKSKCILSYANFHSRFLRIIYRASHSSRDKKKKFNSNKILYFCKLKTCRNWIFYDENISPRVIIAIL